MAGADVQLLNSPLVKSDVQMVRGNQQCDLVNPAEVVEMVFENLGLSGGHKLLKLEQLESGECEHFKTEEEVIAPYSFLHSGIILNRQYEKQLSRSRLFEIMAAVEDLPECERQLRFFGMLGITSKILALTPDIGFLMPLLRTFYPKMLVGSLDDYLWMGGSLNIVVASPDDERFERHGFITSSIRGIVLPHASKGFVQSKVLPFLSTLFPFSEPGHYSMHRADDKNWFAGVYRDIPSKEVRTLLERYLPEALSCPGLGDSCFKATVANFAYRTCYLLNDWSGVLAFLPGIVSASLKASCTSCLVVAPLSRVSQLVKLIAGFMNYMGVRNVPIGCVNHGDAQDKLRIAVGTPDKIAPSRTQKLVLVETDTLISLGFEQQVEKLLCIPDVQVGLHAATRSTAVNDLVARRLPGIKFEPKAGGSLDHVDLYSVETDKKAAKVYEIWRVLGRLMQRMQIAVYCNSPESVKKLGRELDEMGVPVCLHHSGMCIDALKKVEAELEMNELVVTDIFTPSSAMDVVLCDLPRTPQEFVERVLRDRNRGKAKIVISIVSISEERQLLADVAAQYQVEFQSLPAKLPQVYRRSLRPCD